MQQGTAAYSGSSIIRDGMGNELRRSRSQTAPFASIVKPAGGGGARRRYDPVKDMEIVDRWLDYRRRMSKSQGIGY